MKGEEIKNDFFCVLVVKQLTSLKGVLFNQQI